MKHPVTLMLILATVLPIPAQEIEVFTRSGWVQLCEPMFYRFGVGIKETENKWCHDAIPFPAPPELKWPDIWDECRDGDKRVPCGDDKVYW